MIDEIISKLKSKWGFSVAQCEAIRLEMANYALASCMDSEVREEAEAICLTAAEYE